MKKNILIGLTSFVLGIVLGISILGFVQKKNREVAISVIELAAITSFANSDIYNAVGYYNTAKHLSPGNITINMELGLIYKNLRLYDFAINEYKQALEKSSSNDIKSHELAELYSLIGVNYSKLGREDEAFESFQKATMSYPDMPNELFDLYSKYYFSSNDNPVLEKFREIFLEMKKAGALPIDVIEKLEQFERESKGEKGSHQ